MSILVLCRLGPVPGGQPDRGLGQPAPGGPAHVSAQLPPLFLWPEYGEPLPGSWKAEALPGLCPLRRDLAILAGASPPAQVDPADYYFAVSLLDQCYWVAAP